MKKPLLFCALFVGLFGALWFVQRRREKMTAVILSHYPRNPVFARVVSDHFGRIGVRFLPVTLPSKKAHPLFIATSFDKGSLAQIRWCNLDASGLEVSYREQMSNPGTFVYIPPYYIQHTSKLSSSQLKSLRGLLARMPENAPPRSRGDLLLVSFEDGDEWQTRVYDKQTLPPAVKQVFEMAGHAVPLP